LEENKEIMFSGDLIFKNSIGRYDLPGSDYRTLCNSLRKVCLIDKNVKIYSGHGPITTLDIEKKMNPFILQIHQ
jgi:glyoxylase-like metal-dependent hydrolase (beta-lactamase superfamily II)